MRGYEMKTILSFFKNLSNGSFGLSRTYWKLGVLVKLPLTLLILTSLMFAPQMFFPLMLIYLIYIPFLLMGIFNAANNYNSNFIYKTLAYGSVILSGFVYISEWLQLPQTLTIVNNLI
jgi:hypothetical protein